MKSIEEWIYRVFEAVSLFLTGFMAFGVIISVILRYFFNISFVWAEEAITYMFVGTTFLGAVVCQRDKEHIRIDFFERLFPKPVKKAAEIVGYLITIGVLTALFLISINWIALTGNSLSAGVMLPYKYFYSMVPVSSAGMIIFTLIHLFRSLLPNSGTYEK